MLVLGKLMRAIRGEAAFELGMFVPPRHARGSVERLEVVGPLGVLVVLEVRQFDRHPSLSLVATRGREVGLGPLDVHNGSALVQADQRNVLEVGVEVLDIVAQQLEEVEELVTTFRG